MNEFTDALPVIEIETGVRPTHTIVWLHGLGADGNDFVPIIDELELSTEQSACFIFSHAPERPVSINNGYKMRAWFLILILIIARMNPVFAARKKH